MVVGGRERSDSVRNGLFETSDETDGIVLCTMLLGLLFQHLIDRIIVLHDNDAVVPCLQ